MFKTSMGHWVGLWEGLWICVGIEAVIRLDPEVDFALVLEL